MQNYGKFHGWVILDKHHDWFFLNRILNSVFFFFFIWIYIQIIKKCNNTYVYHPGGYKLVSSEMITINFDVTDFCVQYGNLLNEIKATADNIMKLSFIILSAVAWISFLLY